MLGALLIPVSRFVVLPGTVPAVTPIYSVVERNVVSVAEDRTRINMEIISQMRPDLSQDEILAIHPGQSITYTIMT
jgi:hypothetical protein